MTIVGPHHQIDTNEVLIQTETTSVEGETHNQ
jgi:hypothetical protein